MRTFFEELDNNVLVKIKDTIHEKGFTTISATPETIVVLQKLTEYEYRISENDNSFCSEADIVISDNCGDNHMYIFRLQL